MTTLAIHGGEPVRTKPFPAYVTVGKEEKQALAAVIDSGCLSKYLGVWHEQFLGGEQVRALEAEWAAYFGARHAVAVNSCTSGLICAVGAVGISPGDEVIVTPYTMSATATAILVWGGIPVFADVEPGYYCLDPKDVERKITPRTRAIMAVDIFGQPIDAPALQDLAERHRLTLIEDTAQAPGAKLDGRHTGTLGHMGVFSLNYHKHIHCGEGGIILTDDDRLAERCQLIRNHAEAVVEAKGVTELANMVGFNFRMTELEAAVARCQLRKLDGLLKRRLANVRLFEERVAHIPAISAPRLRPDASHAYYVHACRFDAEVAGVPRDAFINAVRAELPHHELRRAEGVKLGCGYVRPLYLQPLFQKRIAFGAGGYPFSLGEQDYAKGLCPVCEGLHERELFTHEFMLPSMTEVDIDDVGQAFDKVWSLRHELRGRQE
ncbi:MAG: DegT/DnrJ/EryC1/StrS family aminotransferase [Proteobacteria bacterium]|nr:DegT/DnrJ/EryC1/StrS family aminotransferase [Pseudomonadota bacterium]